MYRINCNRDLHNELSDSGEISCPFCDQNLYSNEKPKDRLVKNDLCCDNHDIINDNGMLVCKSCGVVQGYDFVKEYVDFYDNRHKFIRKSVYHREYHINNTLLNIEEKYNIEVSYHQKNKIDMVFVEIGKILNEVNGTRKRMISINFIMRSIFKMIGLPYSKIPISTSKKTFSFLQSILGYYYVSYW